MVTFSHSGHSHINQSLRTDGTRSVNNALGYPQEAMTLRAGCCESIQSDMARLPRLALDQRHIHLWLTFYRSLVDEGIHAALKALLTDEERAQQQRFHFADDRLRYLVTRALVRTVLSRYADMAPCGWRFSTNAHGKPCIDQNIALGVEDAAGMEFNISHTAGLIVLAVSRGSPLGVDVENIQARPISRDAARQLFSPSESADLAGLPPDTFADRFFEYWTFKEAYVKARGLGLSMPLDRFSFHFPHERAVQLTVDPAWGADQDVWCLWQCRPSREHLLALCAPHTDGEAPFVTARLAVPSRWEDAVTLNWLKRSHAANRGQSR